MGFARRVLQFSDVATRWQNGFRQKVYQVSGNSFFRLPRRSVWIDPKMPRRLEKQQIQPEG